MQDETRDAILALVELIDENGDWHVSAVEAKEYLQGAGFDPDAVMGTDVELTVHIPGDEPERDEESRFKYDP